MSPFAIGSIGAFTYGVLYCVRAIVRFVIAHPIVFIVMLGMIYAGTSCSRHFNIGSFNLATAMRANPATIERIVGSPRECSRSIEGETCEYGSFDVAFDGPRVIHLAYRGMNREPFDNNDRFYRRVLGMMEINYRAPTSATVDEIVWDIPDIGVITVTSDEYMNVNGVSVRAN